MGQPFGIETEIRTGVVLVTVAGELDSGTADRLVEAAAAGLERADDGSQLVLDVSGVTFADSSGLTALVRCHRLVPGRSPVLLGAGPAVIGPLQRTALDALFEFATAYEITQPHRFDPGDLPPPAH